MLELRLGLMEAEVERVDFEMLICFNEEWKLVELVANA